MRGLSQSVCKQIEKARISKDQKILMEYSKSHDIAVRVSLAKNENLSFGLIVKLSNDPVSDVRQWIALHKKAPLYILKSLSNDLEANVRALLSGNPNTPSDILLKLAKDQDRRVGHLLAQQGRLTAEIVETLIETYANDGLILACLAKNPYLNEKVKQMLYIITGNESFQKRLRIDKNIGEKN